MFWWSFFLLGISAIILLIGHRKGWLQSLLHDGQEGVVGPLITGLAAFGVAVFGLIVLLSAILWGIPQSESTGAVLFLVTLVLFIAGIVGLIWPNKVTFWSSGANARRKHVAIVYGAGAFALLIITALAMPNQPDEQATSPDRKEATVEAETDEQASEQVSGETQAEPVDYEVAKVEDISTDLPGEGQEDTLGEQENLTMAKRYRYMIVLPPLRNEQVRPTLEQVVDEAIAERPDIDGIAMLLYSSEDIVDVGPDVGRATWAPNGEFANITAHIAATNDRSEYELAIDIDHDDLKAYMEQRAQSEELFGFTEAERRRIYKEFVCAEQAASSEAEKIYPTLMDDPDYKSSNTERKYQLMDRLNPQYEALVRERHGITEEEGNKISNEGFKENWPWPSPPLEDIWEPERGNYPIPSECPDFPPPEQAGADSQVGEQPDTDESSESNTEGSTDSDDQSSASAWEMMLVAFKGNHTMGEIKQRVRRTMELYDLPMTEEYREKVGSVVVSLRKEFGVIEMDILTCVNEADLKRVSDMDFPDAAALCVTTLTD